MPLNIYKKYFIALSLLVIYAVIFYENLDQLIVGNISIYPIHAISLVESGTLFFSIEDNGQIETFFPNFHTFLYTIFLALAFSFANFVSSSTLHLDIEHINLVIKLANLLIVTLTGIVFSSFFENSKKIDKLMIVMMYLLLPFSIYGILSADMDQVFTPLFLLLGYKFLQKKTYIYTILFFSFALLSKETMGLVGISLILLGEIFIKKSISFWRGFFIGLLSLILSIIGYLVLCKLFNLPADFIITASQFHIEGRGFAGRNILLFIREFLISSLLAFLVFFPIRKIKDSFQQPNYIFAFILFLSICYINIYFGYINIRYISALMPIILVLLLTAHSLEIDFERRAVIFGVISAALIILVFKDLGIYIRDLEVSLNLLYDFKIWIVFFFGIALAYLSQKLNLNKLTVYASFSAITFLFISNNSYQINFQFALPNAGPALSLISQEKPLISDLPSSELYFRKNVAHSISPSNHYFSLNNASLTSQQNKTNFRIDNIITSSSFREGYSVFTKENSDTFNYFKKVETCNERFADYYAVFTCN